MSVPVGGRRQHRQRVTQHVAVVAQRAECVRIQTQQTLYAVAVDTVQVMVGQATQPAPYRRGWSVDGGCDAAVSEPIRLVQQCRSNNRRGVGLAGLQLGWDHDVGG